MKFKRAIISILFVFFLFDYSSSQTINDSINKDDVKRIISYLASDDLRGRVNYTVEQLEAAEFLAKEFTNCGLKPFPGFNSLFQPFRTISGDASNLEVILRKMDGSAQLDTEMLSSNTLYNIIGLIPGKTKPEEAIVFSAHYDHVNWGMFLDENGQRFTGIFNGANDDASGTTAVLELAKYFAMKGDNQRTLVFCLFAGEELGLLGSKEFINHVNAETIKTVINIEMIGKTNATGKNAFMVTGSSYTNLLSILKQNLKEEKFKVIGLRDDPAGLFWRSDNYPFAVQGVPAHSIMCSDDNDPCYHRPCDDVSGININNMTTVIQAIAKGCRSLISGEDTPSRVSIVQ